MTTTRVLKIVILDCLIILAAIVLFYLVYFKHLKKFKLKKMNFAKYLNKIGDNKTIKVINSFGLSTIKLIYLMDKHLQTKDDNYMMFAINYFAINRNLVYIVFCLVVLVLVNVFYFIS